MPATRRLDPASAIGRVVTDLDAVIRRRRRTDGIRVFAQMYRELTESVGIRRAENRFDNGEFVETLDVVFAELFLDVPRAMSRRQTAEKAWEPLVERRSAKLFPVQLGRATARGRVSHDRGAGRARDPRR